MNPTGHGIAVDPEHATVSEPAGPGGGDRVASGRRRRGRAAPGRWNVALDLGRLRDPAGPPTRPAAYVFAALVVGGAIGLDLLVPALMRRAPLAPFLFAVILAAWWGGRGGGLAALGLGTLGAAIVLQQPIPSGAETPLEDAIRLGFFALGGAATAWLTLSLRSARDRETRVSAAAQTSQSQLLSVLQSTAYPIAALDRDRRLLFANPAAASFFGTTETRALERAVARLLEPEADDEPADSPHDIQAPGGEGLPAASAEPGEAVAMDETAADPVRAALAGRPARWRCRVSGPFEERWAVVQATPIRGEGEGEVEGLVLAWRDVTEDHDAEVAREAFLGILAHELRTPITTVYGGAHLLVSRDGRLPDATRREVAQDILHEATRLNRIAENLLVLSRVERGQLQIVAEPILLEPLIRNVVESEAIRWPATSFSVRTDAPSRHTVSASPGYVEQVLRNLLSNAAKYSPAGSPVEVVVADGTTGADSSGGPAAAAEASATPTNSGATPEVIVRVVDRGPGFDPADAERLFELYYRSAATAVKAPGSGIGLYVCRRLIEAMGGRIWAARSDTGGAEFGFSLPVTVDDLEEERATVATA